MPSASATAHPAPARPRLGPQVLAVAAAEARSLWRSPRAWLLGALASATGVGAYGVLAFLHSMSSFSSPAGFVSPRFLVHGFGFAPLWVLLFGVVLLSFDGRHRDRRERIDEILDAKPPANFAFLAGRWLALAATAALALLLILAAIQAYGLAARAFELPYGEPLEPVSLAAFVFVDALPTLALWCALALLLASALRSRVAVVLAAAALLAAGHWLLYNTPFHLLPAVSPLPSFGTFASDILPRFADAGTLAQRACVMLLAVGMLAAAAAAHPRLDGHPAYPVGGAVAGVAFVAAAAAGLALLVVRSADDVAQRDRWLAAQRAAESAPRPDIQRIEGLVRIDPGSGLNLDVRLTLTAPTTDPPPAELVLSLNPGIEVTQLEVDDEPADFRHDSGLLFVRPARPPRPGEEFALSVRAAGVPDPRFAYLDSAVDYRTASWRSSLLPFLGTEGSIFDDAYVALMPGARWLPTPGPNLAVDPARRPRDFFAIDLEVEAPAGWHVAAPGRGRPTENPNRMRFAPGAPLAEVTVVAAPFERYAAQWAGIEVELLLHPAHTRIAEAYAAYGDAFEEELAGYLDEARGFGVPYPYDGVSVVESPARLRVYGGGRHLASVQSGPGVFLLREHGFPTASTVRHKRLNSIYDNYPGTPRRLVVRNLLGYFGRDRAGGDIFAGAADNLLLSLAAPRGDGAEMATLLLTGLASGLVWNRQTMFTAHAFTVTDLARTGAAARADSFAERLAALVTGNAAGVANAGAWDVDHPSLWERATTSDWEDLARGEPRHGLGAMTVRSHRFAQALRDSLGREGVGDLLAALRDRHAGGTFTVADIGAAATDLGDPADAIVQGFLATGSAPGFVASAATVRRLPEDESGEHRYHVALHVRNEEAARGMARLEIGTEPNDGRRFPQRTWPDPFVVPGRSSVEVGLLTDARPLELWLLPYLSLNRSDMRLALAEAGDAAGRFEPPFEGVRPSSWHPPEEPGIIVDDLDPGFSVESAPPRSLVARLAARVASETQATLLDHGLPAYRNDGALGWTLAQARRSPPPGWMRQEFGTAYGKYRRTLARTASGDGLERAVFKARLPAAGRWRLAYHLPDFRSGAFRRRFAAQSMESFGGWRGDPPGTYHLVLSAQGEETAFEFDADAGVAGWNRIGTFDLPAGDVRLTVTNRSSGDTVVADAIRWRRVEP